jgi:hypothetical protein
MSKCVWALEKEDIADFIGALQEEDARAWLAKVLSSVVQEDIYRVVVTIWAIWHARRKAIHENLFQGPLSTHAFINKFVSKLGEMTAVRTRERQLGHPATRWIPPTGDLAKINVDAAVSKNFGQASMVAIARDSEGNFITVSTVVSYGITETMEAMACREGLALATGALLSKVRVASDCSSVVRSIHEGSMGVYGHIVQEIRLRENTISAVGVCS